MPEAIDVKGKRTRTRWVNPLGPEEPDAAGRDGAAAADDEAARGRASAAAADDEPEPEPELEESEEPLVAQIAQLKAEIKQLRIELGGSPLADDAAADDDETPLVQQTPTNFHQAAVFYLASDAPRDSAMAARAPLLFIGSLSMVVTQTLVALGVFAGTISPTCSSSSQCAAGTYCKVSSDSAWSARCLWVCGNGQPELWTVADSDGRPLLRTVWRGPPAPDEPRGRVSQLHRQLTVGGWPPGDGVHNRGLRLHDL